jgi:group I intron endonuclease
MNNKNNLNKSLNKDVKLVSPLNSDCNSDLLKKQELLSNKEKDTILSLTVIPTETIHSDTKKSPFLLPVKTYYNADTYKLLILKDNKGKSGIYRWTNLITGKSYIGNSVNLNRRFREYYNINHLQSALRKSNSRIHGSLLKYGYSRFSLDIMEYCDKSDLLNREQFYMDNLLPEYNILKLAGSRAGYKYSKESLSNIWTSERKSKHKNWLKLFNESPFAKENLKNMQITISYKVEILDIVSNKITVYDSIRAASREIGCNHATIILALNNLQEKEFSRVFKERYKCRYL